MYEVDDRNVGTLISHGVSTTFDHQGVEKQHIKLLPVAFDVQPQHRLVLVVDTYDLLYKSPQKESHWIDLVFNQNLPPKLTMRTL